MRTINNYIFEKLILSRNLVPNESKKLIEKYKETLSSEKDRIAFERMVNTAKNQANIKGKPTIVVSMYFDKNTFAWGEWKDDYKINGKDDFGDTIIVKIYPENENNK